MSTCLCTDPNCANECHARPGLRAALRAREATLAAEVERLRDVLRNTAYHPICMDESEVAAHCKSQRCAKQRAALRPAEEKP